MFYGGELINALFTAMSARSIARAIASYFNERFQINFCLMLLKCRGTQETDSIMFRYNVDNAYLVMHLVTEMIDRKVVTLQNALIITFYQAQL